MVMSGGSGNQEAEVQTANRLIRAERDVGDGSGGRRGIVLQTRRRSDRYGICAGEQLGEGVGTIEGGRRREVDGLARLVGPSEENGQIGHARVPILEDAGMVEVDEGRAGPIQPANRARLRPR